ncbi:MAG TPA: dihydrofolate reductase family protein [Acidimicrobiia bacterium]
MRKVVAVEHLTLDGVMQAPGRADEDERGGFALGGWGHPRNDEVMSRKMAEGMARGSLLLFGRRTYEDFFSFWSQQTDNPYTEVLDNTEKYVASNTLKEPLPWQNSTLLSGDAADAVAELKQQPGKDFVVLGSGRLVQSLMPRGLVDEFTLMVHPLVLGTGQRLFPDGGAPADLQLVETLPTTTGVVIATYEAVRNPKG